VPSPHDPPAAAVHEAVRRAFEEDLGPLGDLTAALLPSDATVAAALRSRADGVVAGTACVAEAFAQIDPSVTIEWRLVDGNRRAPGDVRPTVTAPPAAV